MTKQQLCELVKPILPDISLDQEKNNLKMDMYSEKYNIGIDLWDLHNHTYANLIQYNYPSGNEEELFRSEHNEMAHSIEFSHQQKALLAIEKGIMLYSFWENEIEGHEDILKEMISARIGKFEKILNARDCEIREITIAECNDFLNENHWQGKVQCKAKIGLFHKTEGLVALQCYSVVRHIGWNLKRTVFKKGHQVRGGISKMFKFFIKNYNPDQVIDYTDIREFPLKHFHDKMGFNPDSEICKPCCYFANIHTGQIVNRETCKKGNKGIKWDDSQTWAQNRINNGLYKCWDAGKVVNIWKKGE